MAGRSIAWLWLLFAVQVSPLWYPTPDSAHYLSIARSFARELRFTDLGSAALFYPPGYPLLMSPAFLTSDRPFLAISLIHLGLIVLLLAGVARWARRVIGEGAPLVTALVAVHVSLWIHFRRPLSELAFMTVAVWTVEALHHGRERGGPRWIPSLVAIAFLPLVREVGIAFAAGFAALSLYDRSEARRGRSLRLPALGLLVIALSSVIAFIVHGELAAGPDGAPAATHFRGLIEPPVPHLEWTTQALRLRVGEIGRLIVPGMALRPEPEGWIDRGMILHLPILVAVLVGWWRLLCAGDVFAATFPFYLAIYLVWGWDAETRYLLPMLPLFAASLWRVADGFSTLRRRAFAVWIGAHLIVSLVHWLAYDRPFAERCATRWPVAESIARDGGDVTAAVSDPCTRLLLAFTQDRMPDAGSEPP